jgi:hypothetical protein
MQVITKEIEEGNIEYKRFFFNLSKSKINHLSAQMNWRINEGNGMCHYYLGICDDGFICTDFTQDKMDYSLDMLKIMIDNCNSYIDTIKLNRYNEYIWLNITIIRKIEFINEYRVLVLNPNVIDILKKSIADYKKGKGIYYNYIIYNNEKILFFECKKSNIDKVKKLVDFNLIINNNNYNNINYNNINDLIEYILNNMNGNNNNNYNYYNDNNYYHINIIKQNYIVSLGLVFFCFLKYGTIHKNKEIILNNIKYNILSIHNNMIDCNEITGPATISIRVSEL